MEREPRTAFVFAGGGSLGASQVGMLEALFEAGLRPDLVSGASVGAINAAFLATEPSLSTVRRMRSLWSGIDRGRIFPIRPGTGLRALLGRSNGFFDSSRLERLLQDLFADRRLDGGQIPCHVVTADALNGDRVVVSDGPVAQAVLASVAIPGIFPPVSVAGRLLVDGGVASNTPLRSAVERGAERVVILPTGCTSTEVPRGALGLALHALNVMVGRHLLHDLEEFRGAAEIRVAPPVCPAPARLYDFSRSRMLMDRAREGTARWLKDGGLERFEVPPGLLSNEACAWSPPLPAASEP